MIAGVHSTDQTQTSHAWTEAWHVWKVIIPRRSITGRLLFGTVLRRRDRRRWIYKRFEGWKTK